MTGSVMLGDIVLGRLHGRRAGVGVASFQLGSLRLGHPVGNDERVVFLSPNVLAKSDNRVTMTR